MEQEEGLVENQACVLSLLLGQKQDEGRVGKKKKGGTGMRMVQEPEAACEMREAGSQKDI
jgi:hypothetical protein